MGWALSHFVIQHGKKEHFLNNKSITFLKKNFENKVKVLKNHAKNPPTRHAHCIFFNVFYMDENLMFKGRIRPGM